MTDEFTRIDELLRRLRHDAPHVEIDNGDDAAVIRIAQRVVLSVDTAVEGTHFKRPWLDFEALGYRSAIVALSDLAAMGAAPRAMLSALIAPPTLDDRSMYAIADGYARAGRQHDAPVVGGNLSRGDLLSLTTTVIGACEDRVLVRGGARVGDALYVTGTLGSAALGLVCLQRAVHDHASALFIDRWRSPVARVDEGLSVREVASAAIDVSDGLLQDLTHVCRASGVGAVIDVDALPLDPGALELARALGVDAFDLALAGGEDYELLLAAPTSVTMPTACTRIGTVAAGDAITLMQAGRERSAPARGGFRHYG